MKIYEVIAGILFTLSTLMKICCIVTLCHAHVHEEIHHDIEHAIAKKKQTVHLKIK